MPTIRNRVAAGSVVHADEALAWDPLHESFETRRINHSICYSNGQSCANGTESFFSRNRRAEIGVHHKISGYMSTYAGEMSWREDNRRESNGQQYFRMIHAAMHHPVSRQWKGYWQRAIKS